MKLRKTSDKRIMFYCQGCKEVHAVNETWSFNGDFESPTFSPSVLVKGVQPITDEEHDLIMKGKHIKPRPFVCHSFVRDGKIEYLNDCTHELASQTVELMDREHWFS